VRNMNETIAQLLFPLGVTANYTGYYYTIYAVELVASDPSHLASVTKDLSPAVARQFSSTNSRVERNIRHTAGLAWKTNPGLLQKMAGHPMYHRPCASQFIAILVSEYKKLLGRDDSGDQQSFF